VQRAVSTHGFVVLVLLPCGQFLCRGEFLSSFVLVSVNVLLNCVHLLDNNSLKAVRVLFVRQRRKLTGVCRQIYNGKWGAS
jgi:hypothetical protein